MTNLIVTAYCMCKLCCGLHAHGVAANGKPPVEGKTCATNGWPFGTRLHIAGIGTRVVTDRTAKKYNGRVDIYIANHHRAKQFGRRKLTITLLK